jgi:hypothetical protein
MKYYVFLITAVFPALFFLFTPNTAKAQCQINDKLCVMDQIKKTAFTIDNKDKRNKTLANLTKSYTQIGFESKGLALIDDISSYDMKATAIRNIGMTAAFSKWRTAEGYRDRQRYKNLFARLKSEAEQIKHPPSYAIAYTYIAMAQAYAHDYAAADTTAVNMKNDALRHKAYAEIAEIQAKRDQFDKTMVTISKIDSDSYQDKIYGRVARIFSERNMIENAYKTAEKIGNPFARTQVLQAILSSNEDEMDINEDELLSE